MANDPGWGNRNNEGPPDLDEVFRQFNRKLNRLFGRGGKGDGQPPESENRAFTVLPIIGLILVIWLATGFYIFKEGSRGVVLRSEEHTSELQSLMRISYAVFCLKKKN